MKRITVLLFILAFSGEIFSQSLTVSTSPAKQTAFKASVANGDIILETGSVAITIADYSLPAEDDPSLEAYAKPDGSVIVRENIANFLMYNTFGSVAKSISNSTQSEGGEAISELAMSADGKTVVLYNPQVNQGGQTGSRAKVVKGMDTTADIYYNQDRMLSVVNISAEGELISLTSIKAGSDDQVLLMDRFGNELNTIEFDQEVEGVSFSENGLFVAIFSGGRVAAYEIRSGERVGSTSFRNTRVQFAAYVPSDKSIIALTGSGERIINDAQIHVVNVEARKIARQDVSGSLVRNGSPVFKRAASGNYTITGFDKILDLRARF